MLTGFNTDFKYKGVVYHVQTEDNGVNNPTIITLLYRGGAILASRKISYADIIKFEKLERIVRDLMEEQHKQVIKDLVAGRLGGAAGGTESGPKPEAEAAGERGLGPAAEPEADADAEDSSLDACILDYLASEEGE